MFEFSLSLLFITVQTNSLSRRLHLVIASTVLAFNYICHFRLRENLARLLYFLPFFRFHTILFYVSCIFLKVLKALFTR